MEQSASKVVQVSCADLSITSPSVNAFERRLDKFWAQYKIKFNHEKCKRFEQQVVAGTGARNLADIDVEEPNYDDDLEPQAT